MTPTPAQKGRCDHEPVCWIHNLSKNPCKHKRCTNDTRSRPAPSPQKSDDYELMYLISESQLQSVHLMIDDAGYTFEQEQKFKIARAAGQLERDMEKRKRKAHDLTQLKTKSDQAEPVRVQQYERD